MKWHGAVAFIALSTSHVAAQNSSLAVDFDTFYQHSPAERHPSATQPVLVQATTDDFVLGIDGVVSSTKYAPAASVSGIATEQTNHPYKTTVQATKETKNNINDVAECGPSLYSATQIEQLVIEAAERHGVDFSLASAVAYAESRFDRQRNSPAGARGPMQLMPDTATRFGVTDVCDAPSNIDAGVRYLKGLTEQFGNPLLAAAAYNAGEDRIREYGGVPPFHETVSYLATILNFQMGLETAPPGDKPASASGTSSTSSAPLSGIIQPTKAGEFIAGVMQF